MSTRANVPDVPWRALRVRRVAKSDRPGPPWGGLVAAVINAVTVQLAIWITFSGVHHPASLATVAGESEPTVIRDWYRQLHAAGTFDRMIRTELLGLLWPPAVTAVGVFLFMCLGRVVRRRDPAVARVIGRLWLLPAAAGAFEFAGHLVALTMLGDPFGFPDRLASVHTGLNWAKIGAVALTAIAVMVVAGITLLRRDRPVRH